RLPAQMRKLFILVVAIAGWAQDPVFEVASVRPAEPGARQPSIRRDPTGGFSASNVSLRAPIVPAHNILDFSLSRAPRWTRSERYDVVAKAPSAVKKSDTWAMLRALLAERFHLAVHRETKELPVYELVVAKSGLKIGEATRPPGPADDWCKEGSGRLQCYR